MKKKEESSRKLGKQARYGSVMEERSRAEQAKLS